MTFLYNNIGILKIRLIGIVSKLSDKQSCKEYFKDIQKKVGGVCKKCAFKMQYWLISKWQFQCSQCHFRTTLMSKAVMEYAALPFHTWFPRNPL